MKQRQYKHKYMFSHKFLIAVAVSSFGMAGMVGAAPVVSHKTNKTVQVRIKSMAKETVADNGFALVEAAVATPPSSDEIAVTYRPPSSDEIAVTYRPPSSDEIAVTEAPFSPDR